MPKFWFILNSLKFFLRGWFFGFLSISLSCIKHYCWIYPTSAFNFLLNFTKTGSAFTYPHRYRKVLTGNSFPILSQHCTESVLEIGSTWFFQQSIGFDELYLWQKFWVNRAKNVEMGTKKQNFGKTNFFVYGHFCKNKTVLDVSCDAEQLFQITFFKKMTSSPPKTQKTLILALFWGCFVILKTESKMSSK